ncbi:hypothetical protein [Boseongicola aestuarii]|nr:hypothetical protein [Boseongicola aestuarii]
MKQQVHSARKRPEAAAADEVTAQYTKQFVIGGGIDVVQDDRTRL